MSFLERSTELRTRPDDCNLILRARRMAQRSRSAAACLPCKANKSKCNDFRPCARCKRLGTKVCSDLKPDPVEETETLSLSDTWGQSANSTTVSDTSTKTNTASSLPNDASAYFWHYGSEHMMQSKRMLADLEENTPADEQVSRSQRNQGQWGVGFAGGGQVSSVVSISRSRPNQELPTVSGGGKCQKTTGKAQARVLGLALQSCSSRHQRAL